MGLPTEIDECSNLRDVPCVVPHLQTHSMVEQLTLVDTLLIFSTVNIRPTRKISWDKDMLTSSSLFNEPNGASTL